MTDQLDGSRVGTRHKENIHSDEEDIDLQLISHRPITNEDFGKSRPVVIRTSSDFHGPKKHKKIRFCREALIIPSAIILLGVLLLGIFLVLTLYRTRPPLRLAGGLVEVIVACGKVQGFVEDDAFAFRGIPYAVPPTGDLRWRKTVLLDKMEDCWQGTLLAHTSGPHCYQQPLEDVSMSEDCLYLDIYSPDVTSRRPKPVVVFFRGSSIFGDDKYSARLEPNAKLAKRQETVLVTVNYRLNAFGFMALKTFHRGSSSASGNYGLHDILAALKWIQMNIDSFGGNPRTITLLGGGSTATAILGLVFAPSAHGFFNQIWITGGSADFVNTTLLEAETANKAFLDEMECQDRHCLLHKSAAQIMEAVENTSWASQNFTDLPQANETTNAIFVIDGEIIPDLPSKLIKREQFNDVSMVIGTPSYQLEALAQAQTKEWPEILQHVSSSLGNFSEAYATDAKQRYFWSDNESNHLQYARMVAEIRDLCPLFQLARRARRRFTNVVHIYTMSYLPSDRKFRGPAYLLDIAAILDQLPSIIDRVTTEDEEFSRSLRHLFFRFVKSTQFGIVRDHLKKGHLKTYLDVTGQRVVPSYQSRPPDCDLWMRGGFYPQYARQN